MKGDHDLNRILANLDASLETGEFVFCSVPEASYGDVAMLTPICGFLEKEGFAIIVDVKIAKENGLSFDGVFRKITLNIHTSLNAVGVTAAVARCLTQQNIPANMVAAYYHDHVFVPSGQANQALVEIQALQRKCRLAMNSLVY